MRLFDSHCHFERADAAEITATLARAREAGVEAVLAVGGSPALNASARLAARLSADSPSLPRVFVACGHDRDQATPSRPVGAVLQTEPATAAAPAATTGISAIGEIGLDYHYSPESRNEQLALFRAQLEQSAKVDRPVIIHTREADDDTLSSLREIPSRGIIHCFTGSPEFCRALLDLGFFISISGIVTFRAADNVRASALVVPDDRLLIETDSPFLAPVPMRGKANEPAFVAHTARFLAELRGTTPEALAETTFRNACSILSIS
ncbi:MAG: TatD family hydrolase [Kiritimatiellae bacterium]|nr:TatD family hydrolase [Kiritimatiellia bacterium]